MLNYFITKRKRRKTYWQVSIWIDGKRVEYIYDTKGDLVAVKDTSDATVQFTLPKKCNLCIEISQDILLWLVNPLLGNGCEISNYTTFSYFLSSSCSHFGA